MFFFILATGDLSELISLESSSAATRKDYVTVNPASTGIAFAIARRLTYPKLAVRLTRLILTWTTRTFAAPTSYLQPPIRSLVHYTCLSSVSLTRRAGTYRALPIVTEFFMTLWICFLSLLISPHSLLVDMNQLLIQTNGEAYPSTALPSTSSSSLSAAVNGSSACDGGQSGLSNNDVRRLQDEVNQLTKRNGGADKQDTLFRTH